MARRTRSDSLGREKTSEFTRGLGRAFGGAVLFAFPLLMTMEMWQIGFSMDRMRLALFIVATLPLLFGLSYYSGFERTVTRAEDAADAITALGVGLITSALMLGLFGIVTFDMPLSEAIGKIGLQGVPASIGAMVASKQFHAGENAEGSEDSASTREARASYAGELFLMMAGALFVAFNVAPTEEIVLIAYTMTPWHALALAAASILVLHIFVYEVGFAGQESRPDYAGFWLTLFHFTIAGYGIALLISLYVLWTFERTVGLGSTDITMMVVVLSFPAALGAATARLIV